MGIIKELSEKTMTEEKKMQAKHDIFAFYVGRPLSYILTIPFLKTNISPNSISKLSIIPLLIGFFLLSFAPTMSLKLVGILFFFIWNLFDGVDGNIARYKKQFSRIGSVVDAASGYMAMCFTFLGMGIGSFFGDFTITNIDSIYIVILGALSSNLIILPRLFMQKKIACVGEDNNVNELKNKANYNIIKIIGLNIISISGFIQVFMLISIVLKIMDLFTIFYFFINLLIFLISSYKLFKE